MFEVYESVVVLISQVLVRKRHAFKIILGAEKRCPFHRFSTYAVLMNLWGTVISASFQTSEPERKVAHAAEKPEELRLCLVSRSLHGAPKELSQSPRAKATGSGFVLVKFYN